MDKTTTSELIKLMSDEKVNKILLATKGKEGLTSKEISEETGIPKTQLYYTLNKMVDADLLEIVKEEKIRNLVEYSYSSYSFNQLDSKISQELSDEIGNLSNISTKWAKKHLDELIQWIVYRDQQFLDELNEELSLDTNETTAHSQPSFYNTEINISEEAEEKLWKDIMKLMAEAQRNEDSEVNRTTNLLIKKW